MNIIGISAFYHDAACCILKDGLLVAAAEEERFTRIKHDPSLPRNAFNYCLEAARLSIADIDIIAHYEDPYKKYFWNQRYCNFGEIYMFTAYRYQ